MTDNIIEFCNKLVLYFGYKTNLNTKLKYYDYEQYSNNINAYIEINNFNNIKQLNDISINFVKSTNNCPWLKDFEHAFNLNGIYKEFENYIVRLEFSNETLRYYEFDKNLINSIKNVQKYNL